ncbi:C1QL [Mytilus edulis]|uniref:C1QL n=1 Tax=Mytilus edulis TaxID=6550 RepID=A0A8S3QR02_MYTED|nr:C1QL [Mytilus edulis]
MLELRETVQKLDNVVQQQSARIYDLETTVTIQRNHIQDLMTDKKTDIEYRRKLERRLKVIENNFVWKYSKPKEYNVKSSNISPHENVDQHENTDYNSGIVDGVVKENERLLLPQDNTASDGLVAFYSYMSNPENNPSAHHTLIYDVSVTNVGNGYNHVTGIFTAPTSGVYVFIWVTRIMNGEHPTELMINNTVYGVTFLRAKNGDDGSVSGNVVANVTKGDSVFVRVHSTYAGDGYIHSNEHGRPSFSGWLLH